MKTAVCVKKFDLFKPDIDGSVVETYLYDEKELFKLPATLEDRAKCETDKSLLQVLPYITLVERSTREVYVYRRQASSSDARSQSKCSIGVGSVMEMVPNSRVTLLEMIAVESARVLEEELGILANPLLISRIMQKLKSGGCGVMYSNRTDTDQSYVVVAFFLEIDQNEMTRQDRGQFMSMRNLASAFYSGIFDLETWSRMVFNMLAMSKKFNI